MCYLFVTQFIGEITNEMVLVGLYFNINLSLPNENVCLKLFGDKCFGFGKQILFKDYVTRLKIYKICTIVWENVSINVTVYFWRNDRTIMLLNSSPKIGNSKSLCVNEMGDRTNIRQIKNIQFQLIIYFRVSQSLPIRWNMNEHQMLCTCTYMQKTIIDMIKIRRVTVGTRTWKKKKEITMKMRMEKKMKREKNINTRCVAHVACLLLLILFLSCDLSNVFPV